MTSIIKFFVLGLFICSNPLNDRMEKMIKKEVEKAFEIESFDKSPIILSEEFNVKMPIKVDGKNFFSIQNSDEVIGYYYVGKGFGKADYFDFIVIFNPELIVTKVKVLVYREDHGGEIGSKRWLKQFEGKTPKEELNYNNVVAISGATLSARSITEEMNKAIKTIGILKENNQL